MISISRSLLVLSALSMPIAVVSAADEVKVSGLHLCCKGCVSAADKALKAGGVSDLTLDQKAGTASFKTADPSKALSALETAGFHASIDGASTPEPTAALPAAKSFEITKAHLCCGKCEKQITAAIKTVPGVEGIEIKDDVVTVTAKPAGVSPSAVMDAVHKAGYHGAIEKVEGL